MFDCVDCIHNKWKGKEDRSYCSLTDEEFIYVTGCRKKQKNEHLSWKRVDVE